MSELEECLANFLELPGILQQQVELLLPYFEDDPEVRRRYKTVFRHSAGSELRIKASCAEDLSSKRLKKLVRMACVLREIPALRVADEAFIDKLICYDERGRPAIHLDKLITEHSHMRLFAGRTLSDDQPVVVKLYETGPGRTAAHTGYEIGIYEKLGFPTPALRMTCFLWSKPVLVMRCLQPLVPEEDDECEVGVQVLEQLQRLHQFTLHSDIKPQNIMRERDPSNSRRWIYHLIDFGGCPKRKLGDDVWARRTWSGPWTSQPREGGIPTTVQNDFLELGFTMNGIRKSREKRRSSYRHTHPRKNFKGKLKTYMQYVESMDVPKYGVRDSDYKALIRILRGGQRNN